MSDKHIGGCLCGKIRFEVDAGKLRDVLACHCGQCRKQTGLFYAATDTQMNNLTINGEQHLTWYHSSQSAKRGFCSICGSALFWKAKDLDRISILAGAFDNPVSLAIVAHIFCADKGNFYDITDGLPQYEKSLSV